MTHCILCDGKGCRYMEGAGWVPCEGADHYPCGFCHAAADEPCRDGCYGAVTEREIREAASDAAITELRERLG